MLCLGTTINKTDKRYIYNIEFACFQFFLFFYFSITSSSSFSIIWFISPRNQSNTMLLFFGKILLEVENVVFSVFETPSVDIFFPRIRQTSQ